MFLLLVSLHLSAWLIVVVSADRFVAVCMPLRAMTLSLRSSLRHMRAWSVITTDPTTSSTKLDGHIAVIRSAAGGDPIHGLEKPR